MKKKLQTPNGKRKQWSKFFFLSLRKKWKKKKQNQNRIIKKEKINKKENGKVKNLKRKEKRIQEGKEYDQTKIASGFGIKWNKRYKSQANNTE